MAFSDRLAGLRKESGLNQKEFADSLGIEASKYNKWENGKNSPDFETVCWFADHFGTTTDFLLGRTDARNPENKAQMDNLGLSETSIVLLKSKKLNMVMEDDTRTLKQIVDYALKYPGLQPALDFIRKLTTPENHWAGSIDDDRPVEAEFIGVNHLPDGQMRDAAYTKLVHDALDDLIQYIGIESTRRWANETPKMQEWLAKHNDPKGVE